MRHEDLDDFIHQVHQDVGRFGRWLVLAVVVAVLILLAVGMLPVW